MKEFGQLMEGHILLSIFIWGSMGKSSGVALIKCPRKADMTIQFHGGLILSFYPPDHITCLRARYFRQI